MKKYVIFTIAVIIILMSSCISTGPPKEENLIILDGKDAELFTDDSLMYEDYEGRYCVGHWKSANDQIIWDFEAGKAGNYMVYAQVACGDGQSGSTIGVKIDGQELTFVMPDTRVWENYADVELGTITLTAGPHTVIVQGKEVMKTYYGNLKSISIIPQ